MKSEYNKIICKGNEFVWKSKVIGMNKSDIEKTNAYLTQFMPSILSDDLVKMVMYGSCARGDYTEDSDIDIALFTGCDRMTAKKYDDLLMDIVTDVALHFGTIVQYVCIPVSEYEEKKSWYGYFKNIEKDGIVLYG
jgi:predicted nucleotidyltransferase